MSVKSKVLGGFVLTAMLGLTGCVVHDPYGYGYGGYSRGYHGGYVYNEYPHTRTVQRRYYTTHRNYTTNDDWRWDRRRDDDRRYDRDDDDGYDRYDRRY